MSMHPTHSSFLDIIPLAGVCTFPEASRSGISVEDNVALLKRLQYALKRSYYIVLSRISATPIYEVKMAFSYHAYLLAENITGLRNRVAEMREPPLELDANPEPAYALVFDEILTAPLLEETLIGLYGVTLPALVKAIGAHRDQTNLLVDQPTVRLLRHLATDLEEMIAWGGDTVQKLIAQGELEKSAFIWTERFETYLAAAGGISGVESRPSSLSVAINSKTPFVYDSGPQRDARFRDIFNLSFKPEALVENPEISPTAKVLVLLFKRFREIDVPEMMASLLYETPDKPWAYYADMTRQLWDEARHALMGEVGFVSKGIDWTRMTIPHLWSYRLNRRLTPLERHAVLYSIEKSLMPKTGKRYEWEVALRANDPLVATFQDYDWADEVLHARIGREWCVSEFKTAPEMAGFATQAENKAYAGRGEQDADWNTEDLPWWPDFYRYACETSGVALDERAIAQG